MKYLDIKMSKEQYHNPVLLNPSIDGLVLNKDGTYVDATFGGGGHSSEILRRLSANGKLVAFDTDEDVAQNRIDDNRLLFIKSNFRYLKKYLRYFEVKSVDGLIADLGVSSHQFDEDERGFSFQSDEPLDMRMSHQQSKTAEDVLMNYSETDLNRIWTDYSEVTNAHRISKQWMNDRRGRRLKTCKEFAHWLSPFVYGPRNKFLAKIFQGLRIEVNEELICLKELLEQSAEVLKPGGRLVILSYHSLEDRIVKQFLKGQTENSIATNQRIWPKFKIISKNAVTADEEEIKINPRSRSVKMRIGEKI